ncbi:MAG: Ig-like domain-containing protein [Candidatus Margulisbacteria bacterium]|nr:Ig-like domain-containing protein [Candidatus Margulisiibacteriota bacterium]
MKKIVALLTLVFVVGTLGLVSGCSQTTPEIKTQNSTTPQPTGLTIRGTVYGLSPDTLGSGGLLAALLGSLPIPRSDSGTKLAGATVVLSGNSQTWTATTDANGEYAITDLPTTPTALLGGGFTVAVTKDGYQRTIVTGVTLGNESTVPNNTEITRDIAMLNNPIITSITPAPGSTIEASGTTITVEFNEAIDTSTILPYLNVIGVRSYALNTPNLTTAWSNGNKTCKITIKALLPNTQYVLQVNGLFDPAADCPTTIRDLQGSPLDVSGGIATGGNGLADSTYNASLNSTNGGTPDMSPNPNAYYRTTAGSAPGTPTGVLLCVNSGTTNGANIDYLDVNAAQLVALSWLAPSTGGPISNYLIYTTVNTLGAWSYLGQTAGNLFAAAADDLNTAIYGATYNASCIRKMAFVTDKVYFKILPVNGEYEGTGAIISGRDNVQPQVASVARDPSLVGVPAAIASALTDYSAAGTTQDLGCYIVFTEPMSVSSLQTASSYTLSTGGPVTAAKVVYDSGGFTVVQLTATSAITMPGGTVTVSTTVPKDLSGNANQTSIAWPII